ncbi:hypothetical protein [Nitrosovibrio tenuis]|nr:hypothetical protein [Nitrosovibrio tenuis]
MKTISFFDLKSIDHLGKDIAAFSAMLNIAEVQAVSNGGINLELSLRYEGTDSIEIHNPLYFVQYILAGSDKTQLFNNTKPPIPLINRQGPIDPNIDFSFNILGIQKNGENQNIHEQVNVPTLTFNKSDRQSYFLQISKYLNQRTRQPEDIPEGIYQLEVIFSIINAGKGANGPQSRTLKAQDISIRLQKESGN